MISLDRVRGVIHKGKKACQRLKWGKREEDEEEIEEEEEEEVEDNEEEEEEEEEDKEGTGDNVYEVYYPRP